MQISESVGSCICLGGFQWRFCSAVGVIGFYWGNTTVACLSSTGSSNRRSFFWPPGILPFPSMHAAAEKLCSQGLQTSKGPFQVPC